MNLYQSVLIVLLIVGATSSFTNTASFWKKQLNITTQLSYETYSGYEEIDWFYPKGQSAMYYSLFGAYGHSVATADERVPLIIWLQGGPGASSQFGAFTELGPIRIVKGKAVRAGDAWNLIGHTIFIDQPLNVGFSYTKNKSKLVNSAQQAGQHLVNFLGNLYKQWPALKKSPLYITGESFAGHYIPAFASSLVGNSSFMKDSGIVLEGVAIGDGWTDPINQINHYDSYLYSVGIVSNKFRDTCTWFQTQAIQHIALGQPANATQFFDFLTNNDDTRYKYWGGMSTFNFRKYGEDDDSFVALLNDSRKQFGVPEGVYYVPGNQDIYDSFQKDISTSYTSNVTDLLRRRIRVLIYNGQNDFVVNTAGVLNYLNSLNWEGISYWKRARKQIWTIHGVVSGWAKIYNNLWFALVNGAGHMVPTDQPEAAFNLLGHFVFDHRDWKE